jgi:hypothetical protein
MRVKRKNPKMSDLLLRRERISFERLPGLHLSLEDRANPHGRQTSVPLLSDEQLHLLTHHNVTSTLEIVLMLLTPLSDLEDDRIVGSHVLQAEQSRADIGMQLPGTVSQKENQWSGAKREASSNILKHLHESSKERACACIFFLLGLPLISRHDVLLVVGKVSTVHRGISGSLRRRRPGASVHMHMTRRGEEWEKNIMVTRGCTHA